MEYVGFIIIGIGVFVTGWLFWTLIIYPNGRGNVRQKVIVSAPVLKTEIPKPQNSDAMDRLWFFDPKTRALVDKARNELPLLYSKMQVLQQKLVGVKVDANRSEGTMMQHDVGGWIGLAVTCLSANELQKHQKSQESLQDDIATLQKQIDEDEAIVSRYDSLSVKYSRG